MKGAGRAHKAGGTIRAVAARSVLPGDVHPEPVQRVQRNNTDSSRQPVPPKPDGAAAPVRSGSEGGESERGVPPPGEGVRWNRGRGEGIAAWSAVPLWAAGLLLAVEALGWVAYSAGLASAVAVDWVPLTATAAAGLAAMWFWRNSNAERFDDGTHVPTPKIAWMLAAFFAAALTIAATHIGVGVTAALIASAAGEEAVFRVAAPALIVAVLLRVRVRLSLANIAAFCFAAAVFAFMPGHVAQADGGSQLPWFALATMWTLMLWWKMPLWVPWLSHATMNAASAVMVAGGSTLWWPIALFVPMACLVVHVAVTDHIAKKAAAASRNQQEIASRVPPPGAAAPTSLS